MVSCFIIIFAFKVIYNLNHTNIFANLILNQIQVMVDIIVIIGFGFIRLSIHPYSDKNLVGLLVILYIYSFF